ncbi:MAG: AbrB/MazE/SpoVT family DNA-binding domain-containing protein [Rhodospirillaceae bacterium]|nr:AbrB/MazE/SpoVT family DNA-binding domain-containing protein [Rhodospirillaceae bacterium]
MKQVPQRQSHEMSAFISGLSTKSEKIRALAKAGFQQSVIGRFLNIRPQFVSNVIRAEREKVGKIEPEKVPIAALDKMKMLTEGLSTKSAKIRALDGAGYTRSQIAKFLGIRYQHVRNVLIQDRQIIEANMDETDCSKKEEWVQVGPDGRIVIPAAIRQMLGVEQGGHILFVRDDDHIRLVSRDAAIKELQDLVALKISKGPSLVDELIAERRAEAARE